MACLPLFSYICINSIARWLKKLFHKFCVQGQKQKIKSQTVPHIVTRNIFSFRSFPKTPYMKVIRNWLLWHIKTFILTTLLPGANQRALNGSVKLICKSIPWPEEIRTSVACKNFWKHHPSRWPLENYNPH